MTLADHVATLDAARTWRATLAVGHDEHTVPPATILWIVGKACRSVEVRASAANALRRMVGAAAPLVEVLLVGLRVEGQDVDRHLLRETAELCKELRQHLIGDGTRLVDGDEQLRRVSPLHTRMDVGITGVDPLDRGGAPTASDGTDKLAENIAPVDDVAHRLADLVREVDRNIAPAVGLGVGVLRGLLDNGLDAALDVFTLILGNLLPGAVLVHRADDVLGSVAFSVETLASGRLVLVGLLLDLLVVPLRGLHGRKFLDHSSKLLCLLLILRVLTAIRVFWAASRHESEFRKRAVTLEPIAVAVLRRVHDDAVDGEVGADVPQLRWCASAAVEVAEDKVIVLVGEHTTDLPLRQLREEIRIPQERELIGLLVVGNGGRGERLRGRLVDVTAQLREERIVLEEADQVPVEVEFGFAGIVHGIILSRLEGTLHSRHTINIQENSNYLTSAQHRNPCW